MSKFKSDQGHYLTKALFIEHNDKMSALYTLKDDDYQVDNQVFPSLRRLFVEQEDLTEYRFATKYLQNWEHWQRLKDADWLDYQAWREELEVRVKARALGNIQEIMQDTDHKDNMQASKFILTDQWKDKVKQKTGPKTKDKIKAEANALFKERAETNEDLQRIKG